MAELIHDLLKNHPIWEKIRGGQTKPAKTKSKNIIQVQDDVLFVWNRDDQSMLTVNLKTLPYAKSDDGESYSSYQTLLLCDPPIFSVDEIVFNSSGALFALVGKHGVTVGVLPRRWGKHGQFMGGKEIITCRSVNVGEHFFMCNERITVSKVAWHPASVGDIHLVVLTNDNCIRIYNVDDAGTPEQTLQLGSFSTHSSLSTATALGETVVSFDFGPVVTEDKKVQQSEFIIDEKVEPVYIVFLLRSNGDVCTLLTSTGNKRRQPHKVSSALCMYPPADDNYGVDASSIICINSSPSVLIISTAAGKIYHCIVLNKENSHDDNKSVVSNWSDTDMENTSSVLYVYECVDLDLDGLQDELTVYSGESVTLYKDPLSRTRYHISHIAGVHSVILPLVTQLEEFVRTPHDGGTSVLASDQPCIVEHLVSTMPLPSSPAAPILGLCFLHSHNLSFTMLLLLTNYIPLTLPLQHNYTYTPTTTTPANATNTNTQPAEKEPFDSIIRRTLQRKSSQPVLQGASDPHCSSQQLLQLLNGATQTLREEYLQKIDEAREEIQSRSRSLRALKEQQHRELTELEKNKSLLKDKAENLAERFDDYHHKQESITNRIEKVLRLVQQSCPVISDAEKGMRKQLEDTQLKLATLAQNISQLKTKQQYQSKKMSQHLSNKSLRDQQQGLALPDNQIKHLHGLLTKETDDITDLVKKINLSKADIGL